MVRKDWKRTVSTKEEQCWECLEKIWVGDEYYSCWKKRPWCVKCREREVSQKFNSCLSELNQILSDLEPKVENEELSITDCQRIAALKIKINEVLKTTNIEDFGLDYSTVETDFEILEKVLNDLDKFLKDNASPQTQDKSSGDKNRGWKVNRECYHEKVEPYEDDPTLYYCSYCWNDSEESFLNNLKRFHQKNLNNWAKKHNLDHLKEKFKITSKLLETFTTQEQIKTVYQQVVKELNQLAKSKGINDPIEIPNDNPNDQERERERERAKLQQKIKRLEKKTNKTPQEEQELANLRNKLTELDKNNQEKNNNDWIKPTLLIGGVVIVVIGLIWLVKQQLIKKFLKKK